MTPQSHTSGTQQPLRPCDSSISGRFYYFGTRTQQIRVGVGYGWGGPTYQGF